MAAAGLFSFVSIPLVRLDALPDVPALFRFAGDTLLPTFSENLLASYLALLGGPLASLCYRLPLTAFEWTSPFLPNLPWAAAAFLGTLAPALGMWAVQENEARNDAGQEVGSARTGSSWLLGIVLAVSLLWFNLGLFGLRPVLVSGVSMLPSLRPGDVVITRPVSPQQVRVGDIISYRLGDSVVLHRVIALEQNQGQLQVITRGDANNVNDVPIPAGALEGRVLLRLPYVGWASIVVRAAIEGLQ